MKHNVRFFVQSPKSYREGEEPSGRLVMRVRWFSKNEVGLSLLHYVNPSKWDSTKQRPMPNTTHIHLGKKVSAIEIKKDIQKYEDCVEECFCEFELKKLIPTSSELKQAIYKKLGMNSEDIIMRFHKSNDEILDIERRYHVSFLDYFDDFVDYGKVHNRWSPNTCEKYKSLRKVIVEYGKLEKLEYVTTRALDRFLQHMIDKKYHNTTIQGFFKRMRQFFRWCISNYPGVLKDESVSSYKCQLDDVYDKAVIFLTEEEFNKVKTCPIPKDRQVLHNVRNLFLFQCMTGLRFSDVFKLRKNNINGDVITLTAKKTKKATTIYLNELSKKIIDEYKDFPFKDNKALPVLSNQKMNKYLKELCCFAGINIPVTISYMVGEELIEETYPKYELMGSHCGRRTFVSLAIAKGATPEEVMRITGHSCYNAMKPYIGLNDKQRKHATAVFDITNEKEELMNRLEKLSVEKLKELINGKSGEQEEYLVG